MNSDWTQIMKDVDSPDEAIRRLEREQPEGTSLWHYQQLTNYVDSRQERINRNQLYHVVFIAMVNEPMEVLRPTVEALAASDYDMSKVIVYIAYEERAGEQSKKTATKLEKEFAKKFRQIYQMR
jgi:cellulose synthase/poly-beta-1,6-N-acetylglucosamine synthase-like glycosyltransferase